VLIAERHWEAGVVGVTAVSRRQLSKSRSFARSDRKQAYVGAAASSIQISLSGCAEHATLNYRNGLPELTC